LAGIIPAKAVVNKYFYYFFWGKISFEFLVLGFEVFVLGFEVFVPERAQIRVVSREV